MEDPIRMDDLGVPLFLETPTCSFFLDFLVTTCQGVCCLQTTGTRNSDGHFSAQLQWTRFGKPSRRVCLKIVPLTEIAEFFQGGLLGGWVISTTTQP